MNKKILIGLIFSLVVIVTFSVTSENESSDIVSTRKKILSNLARENEEVTSQNPPHKNLIEADKRPLPDGPEKGITNFESRPDEKAKVPETKQKDKTIIKTKRVFPPKAAVVKPEGSSSNTRRTESNPGGAVGSMAISGAPRTFIVTENGEGETYLLLEAIRLLNTGDIINLKKGTYSLLIGHLSAPDFQISGEGNETLIELPETLRLQQNLTFKNLKLSNTSTGAAVEIRNQKKMTLENTEIQGNGNDCINISNGNLVATNLKLSRCNRALLLKGGSTVEGNGFKISDSDYGIFSESSSVQAVNGLKADNINLYSIYFANATSGNLTCTSCTLPDNMTNAKKKLTLKNGP